MEKFGTTALQLPWRSVDGKKKILLVNTAWMDNAPQPSAILTFNNDVVPWHCTKHSNLQFKRASSEFFPLSIVLKSSISPILFHVRLFLSSDSSFIFGQLQAEIPLPNTCTYPPLLFTLSYNYRCVGGQ